MAGFFNENLENNFKITRKLAEVLAISLWHQRFKTLYMPQIACIH
jgi:hypothetical protein